MNVKLISSWNLNKIPMYSPLIHKSVSSYSDILKHIYECTLYVNKENKESESENDLDNQNCCCDIVDINSGVDSACEKDDVLLISCVQSLYGYRSGIIGYFFNFLSDSISNIHNPKNISNIFNSIEANDYEVASFILTILTRWIPLLNISVIDYKYDFGKNIFQYSYGTGYRNKSLSGIFDVNSALFCKPIFDSGCAIYSNKKAKHNGFEHWRFSVEKYYNKGIMWCYYEMKTDNTSEGVSVLNFEFSKTVDEDVIKHEINQICKLKTRLEEQFSKSVSNYKTMITGEPNNIEGEDRISSLLLALENNTVDQEGYFSTIIKYSQFSEISNVKFNDIYIIPAKQCDNLSEIVVVVDKEDKELEEDTEDKEDKEGVIANVDNEPVYIDNYFVKKEVEVEVINPLNITKSEEVSDEEWNVL